MVVFFMLDISFMYNTILCVQSESKSLSIDLFFCQSLGIEIKEN